LLLLVLAVAAALLLTGPACSPRFDSIGELKRNPAAHLGRPVRIRGYVLDAVDSPFVMHRFYTVRDSTGKITVFTNGDAPRPGARVLVHGNLESVATIGTASVGVHLSETRRW
jgi:hypothetical protein